MKGLVIGKFYPLHTGHQYLIETAIQQSDSVVVIVCFKNSEKPSVAIRVEWLKELYPTVEVKTMFNDNYDGTDSKLWAGLVKEIVADIDIVFTSEAYGEPFSQFYGCKHVCVDQKRLAFPVSGTVVRNHPEKYWNFLSEPVRHYYMKRFVIVGSESTWKSTIAKAVSDKLNWSLAIEYGREYSVAKAGESWTSQDFVNIQKGQKRYERQCKTYNVVCDTDLATTVVWAKRFLGDCDLNLEKGCPPALYLISTLADSVFVQDGTRDDLESGQRDKMEPEIIKMVKASGAPFVFLTGTLENRIEQALNAIQPPSKFKLIQMDLKSLNWVEYFWLFVFGCASVLFSFYDVRSLSWWTPSGSVWDSFIFLTSGIASFSGVLCVVLVAKKKFSNFVWGIINCIFYGLFSYSFGYIGNFQLNIFFFLPLQFLGIYEWKQHLQNCSVLKNKKLSIKQWFQTIFFTGALSVALYYEIRALAIAMSGSYAFDNVIAARVLDTLTTALSISAQLLLSYRYAEQWYVWIIIDVLQIAMYSLPETLSINILIMWVFFLVNAFYGLIVWLK